MQAVETIGLDIAKSVFQVHGVDADGQVVIRRKLKRRYVLAFFQKLPTHLCIKVYFARMGQHGGFVQDSDVTSRGTIFSLSIFLDTRDQLAARSGEPRHHGAYGHFSRLSDLAIVKALNVAQHQRLSERRG